MIRTEMPAIYLRALEPEDLELLYTIENDEDLWDVSSSCTPISKFAIRQYLSNQPQEVYQSGELRLVIENLQLGRTVGLLDLTSVSFSDRRAEVGIALLKSERGQGIGSVALTALDRYAKKHLGLRLLYAQISAEHNPVSKKLFETSGYHNVALLPEWHYNNGFYEDICIYQKML